MLSRPKKSTILWTSLIAVGVVADSYLLREGKFEDTLTHYGRKWTGVHPATSPWRKRAGQVFWISLCAWTANHFAFGPHSEGRLHRIVVDTFAKEKVSDNA